MLVEPINLIGVWSSLSRAYEIARVGGYKIKIIHSQDYDAQADYQLIKKFYNKIEFSKYGEIVFDLRPPQVEDKISSAKKEKRIFWETLEDVEARVQAALTRQQPSEDLDRVGDVLLKRATQHYELSLPAIELCIKMAATIAKMADKKVLLAEHIAEAIQYTACPLYNENYVIAETPSIKFGEFITIDCNLTDSTNIRKALVYLQDKLAKLAE